MKKFRFLGGVNLFADLPLRINWLSPLSERRRHASDARKVTSPTHSWGKSLLAEDRLCDGAWEQIRFLHPWSSRKQMGSMKEGSQFSFTKGRLADEVATGSE